MLDAMKTRTGKLAAAALTASVLMAGAGAAEFKPYPGAVKYTPPETEANQRFTNALRPGLTITAYFSNDSFEKVVAFYKGLGREYTDARMKPGRLANGEEVRKAFLILDDARDVASSKSWVSIQHPFTGRVSMQAGVPQYSDVREVTEIVFTERKPIPKEERK
jgi:hypothetical protein